MDLVIVNGNSSEITNQKILASARMVAQPETHLQVINPTRAPFTIEGYFDGTISAKAVTSTIAHLRDKADGFIIACFSDPGLYAARELTVKPVIGIAEASMVTAMQICHQFGILSPLRRLRPVLRGIIRQYGFESRCSGITTVEIPVATAAEQKEEMFDSFVRAGRLALETSDAEVLILGGAVLAGMEKRLTEILGVPVLDPVKCAVGQAECLVHLKLETSKIGGFASPQSQTIADLDSGLLI